MIRILKPTICVFIGFLIGAFSAVFLDGMGWESSIGVPVELHIENVTESEISVFLSKDVRIEGPRVAAGGSSVMKLEDIGRYWISASFLEGRVIVDRSIVIDESRSMEVEVTKLAIVESQ